MIALSEQVVSNLNLVLSSDDLIIEPVDTKDLLPKIPKAGRLGRFGKRAVRGYLLKQSSHEIGYVIEDLKLIKHKLFSSGRVFQYYYAYLPNDTTTPLSLIYPRIFFKVVSQTNKHSR